MSSVYKKLQPFNVAVVCEAFSIEMDKTVGSRQNINQMIEHIIKQFENSNLNGVVAEHLSGEMSKEEQNALFHRLLNQNPGL